MSASDWSITALTAALVIITGYYAWQNRRMVRVMERAQVLAIRPKLALTFRHPGPTYSEIAVVNVGTGPALNVDVVLIFEAAAGTDVQRRWRASAVAPSEEHLFLAPQTPDGKPMYRNDLVGAFSRIRLSGSMEDGLRNRVAVDEVVDDLAEWAKLLEDADQRWVEDPMDRIDATFKKLLAEVAKIGTNIGSKR